MRATSADARAARGPSGVRRGSAEAPGAPPARQPDLRLPGRDGPGGGSRLPRGDRSPVRRAGLVPGDPCPGREPAGVPSSGVGDGAFVARHVLGAVEGPPASGGMNSDSHEKEPLKPVRGPQRVRSARRWWSLPSSSRSGPGPAPRGRGARAHARRARRGCRGRPRRAAREGSRRARGRPRPRHVRRRAAERVTRGRRGSRSSAKARTAATRSAARASRSRGAARVVGPQRRSRTRSSGARPRGNGSAFAAAAAAARRSARQRRADRRSASSPRRTAMQQREERLLGRGRRPVGITEEVERRVERRGDRPRDEVLDRVPVSARAPAR